MSSKGKNTQVSKIVSHVLVVLWMAVIFCFTAQTGDESGNLSSGVSRLFMTIWNKIFFLGWDNAQVLAMAELWDYPIRKLAHMTEFGILAVLLWNGLKYYAQIDTMKKRYLFAWVGAVCYAATDEFHQLFVPGRSGNLFDVCVDTLGVTIAIVLVHLVIKIACGLRKKSAGVVNEKRKR